jgi:Abortive infection alpha
MGQEAPRHPDTAGRAAERRHGEPDARFGPLELIELGPTVMRLSLLASLRAVRWATGRTVSTSRRVITAVRSGRPPDQLLREARDEAVAAARRLLGITDLEATVGRLTSEEPSDADDAEPQSRALRARGEQLLARSAQFAPDEDGHPAFGVVLEELAPDEVRILRVLATEGDQAALDVQSSGALGGAGSVVAHRFSMVDQIAGCAIPERIQLYLDNLVRLGLVREDEDPLEEAAYEVLEAQQQVSEAKARATKGTSRAKVVRRRLALSDFGRSFCEACIPATP